jgi:hypothetical protein
MRRGPQPIELPLEDKKPMFYEHIHQSKIQTQGLRKGNILTKNGVGREQDVAYINSSYKLNLQLQFRQENQLWD